CLHALQLANGRSLMTADATGGVHMNGISRRSFIAASTAFAGTLAVAPRVFAQTPKESPFLQAQVDSGALPPVNERLPENPLVITPTERIGQQGGDWNNALVGGG